MWFSIQGLILSEIQTHERWFSVFCYNHLAIIDCCWGLSVWMPFRSRACLPHGSFESPLSRWATGIIYKRKLFNGHSTPATRIISSLLASFALCAFIKMRFQCKSGITPGNSLPKKQVLINWAIADVLIFVRIFFYFTRHFQDLNL